MYDFLCKISSLMLDVIFINRCQLVCDPSRAKEICWNMIICNDNFWKGSSFPKQLWCLSVEPPSWPWWAVIYLASVKSHAVKVSWQNIESIISKLISMIDILSISHEIAQDLTDAQ